LEDGKVFQIAKAKAGEAELCALAAVANHGGTTIRAYDPEVHSPAEELLRRD
jgi:hypothetical protein